MSVLYRKLDNHGDLYHADAIRHRSEIKRAILELCDGMDAELDTLRNALGFFSDASPHLIQSARRMLDAAAILSGNLNIIAGNNYAALHETHRRLENALRRHAGDAKTRSGQSVAIALPDAAAAGMALAGGKAATLGRLSSAFPDLVPSGFVLTTCAYNVFIEENRLDRAIHSLILDIDAVADRDLFRERTRELRRLLETAAVPETVLSAIRTMCAAHPGVSRWAVRSSCAGESAHAAFPGQFDSFLNVPSDSLAGAWRNVMASRFSDRAVSYRLCRGLKETATPMAALFMPMIPAHASGVLFTRDPGPAGAASAIINSVWGLAAGMMLGRAESDSFSVDLSTGEVTAQSIADKKHALVCDDSGGVAQQPVPPEKTSAPSLDPGAIAALVRAGLEIERHWGEPQDIEWAVESGGTIRILQSRNLMAGKRAEQSGGSPQTGELLIEGGNAVFPGWAVGRVFSPSDPSKFADAPTGAILVAKEPAAEITGLLPYLNGIIIENGEPEGRLAARIRESAIPCLTGLDNAAQILARRRVLLDAGRRKVFLMRDSAQTHVLKNELSRDGASADGAIPELLLGAQMSVVASPSSPEQCRSVRDIVAFVRGKTLKFNPISGTIQDR